MGAVDNFLEFFDYASAPEADLSGVSVEGISLDHGRLWIERMLQSGESWPVSRMRDLVEGREAQGLKDSKNESSRDFHIGIEFGRWLDGREVAINGSGLRKFRVDDEECSEAFAQALVDVVAHCRTERGDEKGKAKRVDYLVLTASKVIGCLREGPRREEPQAAGSVDPVARGWPFFFGGDADGSVEHAFVVDDLIHEATVGCLYASQGSLKTQLALDIAAHVGRGVRYQGLRTTEGVTVYVAAEGAGAIAKRLAGVYREHPDLPRDAIVCVPQAVHLGRAEEAAAFAEFLLEHVLPALSMPVRMIAYDTLSKSVPGESDSDAEVISLVESNVRKIAAAIASATADGFTPAGLIVHHPRKNDDQFRGSGAIEGDLDFLIHVKKGDGEALEDRLFEVELQKVKDGPTDRSWAYRGALVHVGTTPSGKENYAPVVRYIGDEERVAITAEAKTKGRKLSRSVRQMIELFVRIQARNGPQEVPREVLATSGYLAQIHESGWDLDVSIAGMPVESLREAFYAERSESVGDRSVSEKDRSAWRRRIDALVSSGSAMTCDGWVWLVETTGAS